MADPNGLPEPFAAWFARRGWHPHPHQLEMLAAAHADESALLIAPTGGGKTLAGFLPGLIDLARRPRAGLHTLYVSPLKALTVDIHRNLTRPITTKIIRRICAMPSSRNYWNSRARPPNRDSRRCVG